MNATDRRYHVEAIRVDSKTGIRIPGTTGTRMTSDSVTHDEGCVMLRKCTPYRHPRGWELSYRLVEA